MMNVTNLARVCYETTRMLEQERGNHSMREWNALVTREMRAPFRQMVRDELAKPGSSGDRIYAVLVASVKDELTDNDLPSQAAVQPESKPEPASKKKVSKKK